LEIAVVTLFIGIFVTSFVYHNLGPWIDKSRTPVKWHGTMQAWGIGHIVGFLVLFGSLESNWHFGEKGYGRYTILMAGITIAIPVTIVPHIKMNVESPGLLGPNPKILTGPVVYGSILGTPIGTVAQSVGIGLGKCEGFFLKQLGLDLTLVNLMSGWCTGGPQELPDIGGPSTPEINGKDDIFIGN